MRPGRDISHTLGTHLLEGCESSKFPLWELALSPGWEGPGDSLEHDPWRMLSVLGARELGYLPTMSPSVTNRGIKSHCSGFPGTGLGFAPGGGKKAPDRGADVKKQL